MRQPLARTPTDRVVVAVDARPLIHFGNGVSRLVLELVREMREMGSVRLLLMAHRPLHSGHDLTGLQVIVDDAWRHVPGTLWYVARMNALARHHGANVVWGTAHVLPFRADDMRYVVSCHDLVHLVMPGSMRLSNLLLSRLLVDRSLRNADAVVALSQTTRHDLLTKLQVDSKKVVTILPGVSRLVESGEQTTGSTALPDEYLFTLGSLEPRKNIDGLLRCFASLTRLRPNLVLVIAGAHEWRSQATLRLLEEPCFRGKVIRVGYLSDVEIARYFENASAFVMSSHYEGFGLPVLEAAGRCPIVLAAVPIFEELSSYISGTRLVDFQNPSLAAADIDRFLDSRPDRARVRETCQRVLTWSGAARRYVQTFGAAASRGDAGVPRHETDDVKLLY